MCPLVDWITIVQGNPLYIYDHNRRISMLRNPTLILLLLNLSGVALCCGLALTGLVGDFGEVVYTGMAGVALLTITLGITFLFLGRLKTLGAVLGLLILIPLCIFEMCLYSWNAPFRPVAGENLQVELEEVILQEMMEPTRSFPRGSLFQGTSGKNSDFFPFKVKLLQANMNPSKCQD